MASQVQVLATRKPHPAPRPAQFGPLPYKPFGEYRYNWGGFQTTRSFTGQLHEMGLDGPAGLYHYGARWYDPALGRFIQADTIVPEAGNPMAWDRYAYAYNNPVLFIDPTGHFACEIGKDAKGITVTDCEDWVNSALRTLSLTETGKEIVDKFRVVDERDEITIVVGGTIFGCGFNS